MAENVQKPETSIFSWECQASHISSKLDWPSFGGSQLLDCAQPPVTSLDDFGQVPGPLLSHFPQVGSREYAPLIPRHCFWGWSLLQKPVLWVYHRDRESVAEQDKDEGSGVIPWSQSVELSRTSGLEYIYDGSVQ